MPYLEHAGPGAEPALFDPFARALPAADRLVLLLGHFPPSFVFVGKNGSPEQEANRVVFFRCPTRGENGRNNNAGGRGGGRLRHALGVDIDYLDIARDFGLAVRGGTLTGS